MYTTETEQTGGGDARREDKMQRIQLKRDVERFPHFVARRGLFGTVILNEYPFGCLVIKMDKPIEGAEEWDNCIIWNPDFEGSYSNDVKFL